jgi:hypothetical protein
MRPIGATSDGTRRRSWAFLLISCVISSRSCFPIGISMQFRRWTAAIPRTIGWTLSARSGRRFQAPTISPRAATARSMFPRASKCCVWPVPATRRARSSPSSTARQVVWPFIPTGACWSVSPAAAWPRSTPAAGSPGSIRSKTSRCNASPALPPRPTAASS